MKEMWAITSGSYSDYRVHAICDSEATAEKIVARANKGGNERYMVESFSFVDDPEISMVDILHISVNIWDNGTQDAVSERYSAEWPFDSTYGLADCFWRWVRAPIHGGRGGRLDVWGTDHERVRKVFGDQRAMFLVDDAMRAKKELHGSRSTRFHETDDGTVVPVGEVRK